MRGHNCFLHMAGQTAGRVKELISNHPSPLGQIGARTKELGSINRKIGSCDATKSISKLVHLY
jgi:hypothetical protein